MSSRWDAEGSGKSERNVLIDDTVLLTCGIAARGTSLPTQRTSVVTNWEVTGSVIIAVSSLTCTIVASNDDRASEGGIDTEGTIDISVAGDSTSGRVNGDLRAS